MPQTRPVPLRHALAALGTLCLTAALLLGLPCTARATAAVPLYGGMPMTSDTGTSCHTGFNARHGTSYVVITAGSCLAAGSRWSVDGHPLGSSAGPAGSGYGLVTVDDTDYWRPTGAVLLGGGPTPVTRAAQPAVGMRVCAAAGAGETACGTVTAVDVSVDLPQGVVTGLAAADLSLPPGSTGSPAVSGGSAVGIVLGGNSSVSYLQPVVPALSDSDLSLV